MMNITIVYHCGIVETMKSFYRELNKLGVKVSVIVPKKIALDPVYTLNKYLKVRREDFEPDYQLIPVDLINPRRYNLGFNPVELCRAIRDSKPDTVHIFNEYHCFPVTETILIRNFFLDKKIPVLIYAFQNIDYLYLF